MKLVFHECQLRIITSWLNKYNESKSLKWCENLVLWRLWQVCSLTWRPEVRGYLTIKGSIKEPQENSNILISTDRDASAYF